MEARFLVECANRYKVKLKNYIKFIIRIFLLLAMHTKMSYNKATNGLRAIDALIFSIYHLEEEFL